VISVLIAPVAVNSTRTNQVLSLAPILTAPPVTCEPIIAELQRFGSMEAKRWTIISAVEPDRGGLRSELRQRRSAAFKRLESLIRNGTVKRVGRHNVRLAASTVVELNGQRRLPCCAA